MAGAGLKPTPKAQARRLGHQWIETIVKPRFLDECHSERSEESSHFSSIDPSLTLRVSEKAILKTYRQSRMSLEFFQDNENSVPRHPKAGVPHNLMDFSEQAFPMTWRPEHREAWQRRLRVSILVIFLILPGSPALTADVPWLSYRGAWFAISYPAGFTVRPSQKSATSTQGYDSVFFRSPDGQVEFYVYSPQWLGDPKDIELNPASEVLMDESREQANHKSLRRVTIRAKDRSYYKSFVDETTGHNTRTVLGIIYRDRNAYQRYRRDYLRFKQSLRQYAD
jgi:hypothetical protein